MNSRDVSGFRICTDLFLDENAESKKCFIFINKQWLKIKNVKDHIINIFSIEEDIDIFVGDILLPENETIKLIQTEDVLIVKKQQKNKKDKLAANYSWDGSGSAAFPDYTNTKPKVSCDQLVSSFLQELHSKKEQITKSNKKDTNPFSTLNGESSEIETVFQIPTEKKRKRKHKKKSKTEEIEVKDEVIQNKSDLINLESSGSSSKHLHFMDEEENNQLIVHSSPKKNEETVEEVRSTLLQLANKPVSEKIFPKKIENSVEKSKGDEPVLSTTESNDVEMELIDTSLKVPKVGDVIGFKKIKLGQDYTPQESGPILGEVMNVKKKANDSLIVFNILEGVVEFEEPTGKFSLESEEINSDKVIPVVELYWKEVLEPSLKKRVNP